MDQLFSVYLACTIFGVGVTIIDMLGILGDLFHEGDDATDGGDHGDHGDDGGDHGEHGGEDDGGIGIEDHGGDGGDGGDDGDDGGDHGDHEGEHEGEHDEAIVKGEKGSVTSHEHYQERHILLAMRTPANTSTGWHSHQDQLCYPGWRCLPEALPGPPMSVAPK